jgi:tRNA A-37 threonylcarbamoyl transferase component Bud32
MPFRCIEHADGGAHGDIYKGEDGLGRPVCVKLVRPSVGDSTFVLEQAKALARVNSPNVAIVLDITDVNDPESGETVPAIIMEWIEGKNLDKVLSGPKLSLTDARRIGLGVIGGMEAIHAAKVAHRDFHFRNVMIGATVVKIIDILYYHTLAGLSSDSRARQYQIDRNALRSMLASVLAHSSCGLAEVDAFSRSLGANLNFDQIRIAFDRASIPAKMTVREKSAAEILGNLKGITLAAKFGEKVEELYLGRWTQEPGWQATVHGLPSKYPGGLWHCMFQEAGSGTVVAATTIEDLSMLRSGDSVTVSGRIREVSRLDYVSLEDATISTKAESSESRTVTGLETR